MKRTLILWATWALLINLFAVAALNRYNLNHDTAYDWITPERFSQAKNWDVVGLHARFDSEWYLDIATNGYRYSGPKDLSTIAFFPLYPALLWLGGWLTGGNLIFAGWSISLVALLLSLWLLRRLAEDFHPQADAELAPFLLLAFPTAFFLNAVYTESLFLLWTLAFFFCLFRRNYAWAALFGLLAALTRFAGIFLLLPFVWELFSVHGIRGLVRKGGWLLIPASGTAGVFAYHWLAFGDPLLFFKVQAWWGRDFSFQIERFTAASTPALVNLSFDVGFFVIGIIGAVFAWRLRPAYSLYMLASLGAAIASGTLMSIGRFVLVLFPIYLVVASFRNQQLIRTWLLGSILGLSLYTSLFVNNYWAG